MTVSQTKRSFLSPFSNSADHLIGTGTWQMFFPTSEVCNFCWSRSVWNHFLQNLVPYTFRVRSVKWNLLNLVFITSFFIVQLLWGNCYLLPWQLV